MSSVAPLEPIAAFFERSLNIHRVYGEPVHFGETTIIPVAKVAFGFGAGGGRRPARERLVEAGQSRSDSGDEVQGGGGGGGARLSPVGVLEVGPRGTRFIRYNQFPRLAGTFALGLGAGWLLARRRTA
jgi:uncharacterized spore protein YtfJ